MKTSEFKKILKPLIEQTVKEVLLKEGVLSKIVSEVARGLQQPLLEAQSNTAAKSSNREEEIRLEEQKKERIKRLNESTGFGSEVFNNVGSVPESATAAPLSGVAAGDSGVDISAIQKISNGKWKQLLGDK